METMDEATEEFIGRALRSARTHVGMDVGFISELRDGRRWFRFVDTAMENGPIEVGGSDPLAETYCHYVASGRLPELLVDPRRHPVASELKVTHELPVGTHLSVPVRFSDGTVYGTFCCFSSDIRESVDESALTALRVLADIVADYLESREAVRRQREQRRQRLRSIVAGDDLRIVFQPIVALSTRAPVGYEALARFPKLGLPPDLVFAEGWRLGLGVDLEMTAVTAALAELPLLEEHVYLAVNASPATLTAPQFAAAVQAAPIDPARLVVEVTEHAVVEDYDALHAAGARLGELGVRLAVDDVGMGISGLNHILRLSPDILKIDASLVRSADENPAKQAMISAMVGFADRTGPCVVAEGIETAAEWETLRALGVAYGQGFHIGRPNGLTRRSRPSGA